MQSRKITYTNSVQPKIQVHSVFKVYETSGGSEVLALENINLEVESNEFVTLVGPSGCGKSTLLRMVAGLEDANEGNILIDNKKGN